MRTCAIIIFICVMLGLLGFSLRDGLHVSFSTSTAPLFSVVALSLLFVAISELAVLRWVIYWTLLGSSLLLFLDLAEGNQVKGFFDFDSYGSVYRLVVYIGTAVLISLTLLVWFCLYFAYLALFRAGAFRPVRAPHPPPLRPARALAPALKMRKAAPSHTFSLPGPAAAPAQARLLPRRGAAPADDGSGCAFEYRAWSWSCPWGRRWNLCTYEGDLCPARGVPHGWGMWCDDHPHGERLMGWWEDGMPIGPFTSSTVRKGYAFSCVQMAVCTVSAQPWDAKRWWPRRAPAPAWGVVAAEVSVAGHFFRHLPRCHMALPLSEYATPAHVLSMLKHAEAGGRPADCLTITLSQGALHVAGHQCATAGGAAGGEGSLAGAESVAVGLSMGAWGEGELSVSGFARSTEALVWICGYNTCVEEVGRAVGQFIALANIPPWIKPVLFSWPTGCTLTYLQADTHLVEHLVEHPCGRDASRASMHVRVRGAWCV